MAAASFRGNLPPPALDHAPSHATIREDEDARSDSGTRYFLPEGDVFQGSIGTAGDTDWIAVTLTAGQSRTFRMDGISLADTVLELVDAEGASLAYSDDAGALERSEFTYTATSSGIHYLVASGFSAHAGSYRISHGPARPGPGPGSDVLTMTEIARYLTDGFWADHGYFRHAHDARQGSVLSCDISDLGAAEQRMARMALNAWSEVTGLRFDTASRAGEAASIRFVNDDPGGAYSMPTAGDAVVVSALINIPADWAEGPEAGFDSYFYQTCLHEIGHALGLGHAGPYNGSASFGTDNAYANDSWQASLMSYFSQADNTVIDASYAYAVTPMRADIIAVHDLYGTPRGLNDGNSVWGEGGTVAGALGVANGLMVAGAAVTMTIFDQGGTDWLRLGSDRTAQSIDLRGGAVSSVYGLTGNLSIAQGTVIENLVAGSGNDLIRGNAAANWLIGGAGMDTIHGHQGNDTLEGGAGADLLAGGTGDDLYIADALDRLVEAADGGIDRVRATVNFTLAEHLEALLLIQSFAKYGTGNAGANTVAGNSQANYLSGAAGNDTLFGMAGDDTLDGNAGADRLVGGDGDDLYLRDRFDTIVEAAGGGFDTVITRHDIVLGAHVEKVVVEGDLAVQVTGNAADNVLIGNGARNLLIGGGGRDEMSGGGGADVFVFTAGQTGRVLDFQDDLDAIRIDGARTAGLSAGDLDARTSESGGGVSLDILGGVLRIDGMTLDALRDDLLIA
ncbi:M10 family metallopeptidase [Paracoccus sp. MC1862]|uniref:M10 family metallopeptidase n=1 Tax=Paracoccus sp. MC1862 TaxID=2760307 RepID=UPI0015FFA50F|nr:M10 family metallopeptidase C-terminal domain-containing protein [Paracoccus sp. MC1862]MBB1497622.1 M10 family metallopeptidase C-terminal domain-containing protein [Paracoccus sp. MC1862]QQO44066.1 M10 family metallopeptidase C-terminal domain-containing protein [Paracoccus sp. MC1862]